jgi:hypothetical protein
MSVWVGAQPRQLWLGRVVRDIAVQCVLTAQPPANACASALSTLAEVAEFADSQMQPLRAQARRIGA